MNKLKAVVLFFCLHSTLAIFAQDKFSSYENSYYGKNFDIQISLKTNIYSLWINALAIDDSASVGGIIIREKNFFTFLESLKMAKLKYEDYSEQAKKNGIKREDKTLRIFNTVDVFSVSNSKYVFSDIPLDFEFRVRQRDGQTNYLLFINAEKYSLVFTSPAEIQAFIDKLSSAKINEYVAKNQDVGFLSALTVAESNPAKLAGSGFLSKATLGLKLTIFRNFGMNDATSPTFSSLEVISYSSSNTKAFALGAFARMPFGRFLIQPEVSYQMGRIFNSVDFYDYNIRQVQTSNTIQLSKIDVPLLIGYNVYENSKTSLKVLVGTNFLFNVGSRMENNHFIPPLGSGATNLNDIEYSVDPLTLGIVGGFEFDYYPLTIGVRYNLIKDSNHTMIKINDLTGKYSQKIGHLSANTFEFSIGWKIFYPRMNK